MCLIRYIISIILRIFVAILVICVNPILNAYVLLIKKKTNSSAHSTLIFSIFIFGIFTCF